MTPSSESPQEETWTVYVCPACNIVDPGHVCHRWMSVRGTHRYYVSKPIRVVPAEWKERAERAEAARDDVQRRFDAFAALGLDESERRRFHEAVKQRDEARALALELAEAVEATVQPLDDFDALNALVQSVRALADTEQPKEGGADG